MEYDFLRAVARLNGHQTLSFRRLFQGDRFVVDGSDFECIWPPRAIDDHRFEARITKALDSFREAREADPVLQELEECINRHHFYGTLTTESPEPVTFEGSELKEPLPLGIKFPREIQPETKKANKLLTEVANHMSLAFRSGSWLLLWGDVFQSQLPDAVQFLRTSGIVNFDCMVAPHHGTYWQDCLQQLRSVTTLVSHGPKLISKFRPEWKSMSRYISSTYLGGDLDLWLGPRWPTA